MVFVFKFSSLPSVTISQPIPKKKLMSSTAAKNIFERLVEIVECAYSGIEVSDCQDLLTLLNSVDGGCDGRAFIITDVDLKELIDKDLQARIDEERISTTQKIQEVLDGCPGLADFFSESKVFDSLRSKFKKTLVLEKLKQNPSLLMEVCREIIADRKTEGETKVELVDEDDNEEEGDEDDDNDKDNESNNGDEGEEGEGNLGFPIWEAFLGTVATYMKVMDEQRIL